ncbi:MAG TPA: T9SS type A sorting domain-containing protein [Candidatus Barnesiella excrementavium]|nr:T9SS type A sorting domain-containing protein [Candidatus Barnesiella excrementavium]
MKRKLFLFSGILALSLSAHAQELRYDYMTWPDSQKLGEYASQWTPGTPLFEDENFYISRVKPKARFRNARTQVNESLNETNDKKLLFWVPIGDVVTLKDDAGEDVYFVDNARPNGKFDNEAFSMWSYVTHYGNWTAPQGWVPGAFADVAHKNGVGVSGVASVPWGDLKDDWKTALNNMSNSASVREKVAQFLHYHGVDGLGYNSEFGTSDRTLINNLNALNEKVHSYLTEKGNPVAENIWYDGTDISGSCIFDRGLGDHNKDIFGDGQHIRTTLFSNYNWHGTPLGTFNQANVNNKAPGRSLLDIYAGFNMQGGDPSTWTLLEDYDVSIGLWGAHSFNMLWGDRGNYGSTDLAKQLGYQTIIEQFFSNGNRNPIDAIKVFDRGNHHPNENWFGMSAFMSARSSLSWDLSEEPFISYFNLGNGQFFNWMGERQNDNEWYNIGVQDYLPTWRYWFASEFLGKTADKVVENGLEAQFTYDDAYVGGSCLRIFGSSANEYLHLFKTKFALSTGDKITLRYKLVGGQADVNLAFSVDGAELTPIESRLSVLTVADGEVDNEVWVEKTFTLSGPLATSLANKTIAMVALHFENASNLDLYLGEFSITRGTTATPAAPEITKAKVLAANYQGVDAKVIFNMASTKTDRYEPVYNLDVNTSLFKLYAQQEDEEEILMGITTSWAGMYYSIPTNWDGTRRVRLGVAAVSVDMKSESLITWSEYMDMGNYTTTDEIQIDKTTIKPGESFEISYVDPRHEPANWQVVNSEGTVVAQANNTTVFSVPDGIQEIGGYDVKVTFNGETTTYGYYVQITSEAIGALPEIQSLTVNEAAAGSEAVEIETGDQLTLGYTGRSANGASSRGVQINDCWVGGRMGDSGIEAGQSFSVAAWVRFTTLPASSSFFSIENRTTGWPVNNWGWMWSNITSEGRVTEFKVRADGAATPVVVKYTFPNTVVSPNAWNHVVLTFEYNTDGNFRSRFYLNGVLQESTWEYGLAPNITATGTTNDWVPKAKYDVSATDWFCFAGGRGESPTTNNGIIDELLIWNGGMEQADVDQVRAGLDGNSLPANVIAYWDFETNAGDDLTFAAKGSQAGAKASVFKVVTQTAQGSGIQTPQTPLYTSGCPFIDGEGFQVETRPTWSTKRGVFTESTGTDLEGSTKLSYTKAGDYTVTLKLENSLGSDTRTYPVFKVDLSSGVEDETAAEMRTYTVDDVLFVEFVEDGDYQVSVYNVSGMLVAQDEATVAAGQQMRISLGAKGVYVVKVMKEGKVVRSVKVLNR